MTGEPTAGTEPPTVSSKPDASRERLQASQVAPEKVEQLESQMERVRADDMVRFDRRHGSV